MKSWLSNHNWLLRKSMRDLMRRPSYTRQFERDLLRRRG